VSPRNLRSHQIHIIVARDRQQDVSVADPGFALNIDVNSIPLDQFDALELRRAAETAGFLIDDGNMVASIEE
jgi:hypothetical protein